MSNGARVGLLFDKGSFQEDLADMTMVADVAVRYGDNYRLGLEQARQKTGLQSPCLTGRGTVCGVDAAFVGLDFAFMGGSFDPVVTNRIVAQMAIAQQAGIPVVLYVSSTGPGVHFGVAGRRNAIDLTQLLTESSVLTIAVCTQVVAAAALFCFAACDHVIAEPNALIITQGRDLVTDFESARGSALPEGFQTAKYGLDRGVVDSVVRRAELREHVARHIGFVDCGSRDCPTEAEQTGITTDPHAVPIHEPWQLHEELTEGPSRNLGSFLMSVMHSHYPSFGHGPAQTSSQGPVFSHLGTVLGLPVLGIALGKQHVGKDRLGSPFGSLSLHDITRLGRMLAYAEKRGVAVALFVDSNEIEPSLRNIDTNIFGEMRRLLAHLARLRVPTATVIVGECSRLLGEIVTRTGHTLMLEKALNMLQSPENTGYKTGQTRENIVAASRVTARDSLEDGFVEAVCLEEGRQPDQIAGDVRKWLALCLGEDEKANNKLLQTTS